MPLAYESNVDLAFDTMALREYGNRYGAIADDLRIMANKLDTCLQVLKDSGWTTPAGTAFYKMTDTNWKKNIDKYADLLDTLKDILNQASIEYENLVRNHIEQIQL